MKALLGSVALCALAALASSAFAVDPAKQSQTQDQPAAIKAESANNNAAQKQTAKRESTDPNYRYQNGRWFYRLNDKWLVWNGDKWENFTPTRRTYSYEDGRSYSYFNEGPGTNSFVPTEEALPPTDASGMRRGVGAPYTVEYQKIVPSFGVRSAGSKVLGEY